jgi:uncharacterized integral membrane protein
VATRRGAGKSQSSSGTGSGTGSGSSQAGRASSSRAAKDTAASTGGSSSSTGRRRGRTSDGGAAGGTARARISAVRRGGRAGTRPKPKPDMSSVAEPTVTATDEVLAASNAQKALSPDMPRVAWLRTQLQNLEAERAERLVKVAQLTLIAIIFITFVLQNAEPVSVTFLVFSLNIRLIWVIVGCGLLGGVAGYLIGRPDKSIRALIPKKDKPAREAARRRTAKV